MDIIEMRLDEIYPYQNNPRKNDDAVNAVALSISSFGFKVPIVVDKDNVIIAGHTRLKAAKKLGLSTVPVVRADDLTEDQVRAFRLADNKVSELSEWDWGLLEGELAACDMDMSLFGFDTESIKKDIDKTEREQRGDHAEGPEGGYEHSEDGYDGEPRFNVIIVCLSDNDREWLKEKLAEENDLKRLYMCSDLIERIEGEGGAA